jgi:integrase
VLAARQQGEFADPVLPDAEPLRAAWEISAPAIPEKTKPRLSDVTPLYIKRLETHGRKTQTTNLSWWVRLIDFCGDKFVEDVSSLDIYKFFESRLLAEKAAWSMKYSMKVRAGLTEAFGEAKTREMCRRNPVSDLDNMPRITAAEEQKRKRPRHPYSTQQLNILLSSAWYDPRAQNWKGRMKWDLGARYWIPLLCLYQGFRVREPLQLRASDILIEAGFPLVKIDVAEDDVQDTTGLPQRTLKNDATKRVVPIHPVLLELGFMDFVASAKKRGVMAPLFPSAVPERASKQPMWGRAYEQRFVPFVRDVLEFGAGFGNHSFRHTLEDCLRNAQFVERWPAGLGQFYTGRTLPSDADRNFFLKIGSERAYGKGYDPTLMMPFVKHLQYKGIQLPKPFSQWLDGRPAVDSHLISVLDSEWGNEWRGDQ